jgi:hypothetical protein
VTHTCPRRHENGMHLRGGPFKGAGEDLDEYVPGHGLSGQPSGCSYCGSMSPQDFMHAVVEGKQIGPTDKSYKLYVGDYEGKFYTSHLTESQGYEFWNMAQLGKVNWGYPGYPYVPLYIPGPSTQKADDS